MVGQRFPVGAVDQRGDSTGRFGRAAVVLTEAWLLSARRCLWSAWLPAMRLPWLVVVARTSPIIRPCHLVFSLFFQPCGFSTRYRAVCSYCFFFFQCRPTYLPKAPDIAFDVAWKALVCRDSEGAQYGGAAYCISCGGNTEVWWWFPYQASVGGAGLENAWLLRRRGAVRVPVAKQPEILLRFGHG